MDEQMMKAGGAAKRVELQKMFGELSISSVKTRELTEKEKKVAVEGDTGQGERLNSKKK